MTIQYWLVTGCVFFTLLVCTVWWWETQLKRKQVWLYVNMQHRPLRPHYLHPWHPRSVVWNHKNKHLWVFQFGFCLLGCSSLKDQTQMDLEVLSRNLILTFVASQLQENIPHLLTVTGLGTVLPYMCCPDLKFSEIRLINTENKSSFGAKLQSPTKSIICESIMMWYNTPLLVPQGEIAVLQAARFI